MWFRADGKRMQDKDWQDGGWMRTLGMFMNGAAAEIRDDHGQCAEDTDFLLLLNAHHETVPFRISFELYHGGWKLAFDTSRPMLSVDTEPVGRNRLVKLAARSLVLLSHER
jgi:glycogen operon protein